MTRAKRLQELMRHHNFLCTCPACTTDLYPLINKQASNNNKEVLEIARIAAEGIKDWNREVARDKYLFFIQLLQEHHTTLPTRELSILHQWSLIVLATTTRPDESF